MIQQKTRFSDFIRAYQQMTQEAESVPQQHGFSVVDLLALPFMHCQAIQLPPLLPNAGNPAG